MRPADLDPLHFVGDRMISVSCQAIDTSSDQKMGANGLGRAEELIDIAFAITDVNAARRIAQRCRGLREVLQPADALFLLDRNSCQVHALLERCGSLEFLARPEFDRGQPEGKTFARHGQAGMHQDATNSVRPQPSSFVPSAVDAAGHANEIRFFTLKREFSRVV